MDLGGFFWRSGFWLGLPLLVIASGTVLIVLFIVFVVVVLRIGLWWLVIVREQSRLDQPPPDAAARRRGGVAGSDLGDGALHQSWIGIEFGRGIGLLDELD